MKKSLLTIAVSLILAACGGGGDDDCTVTYEVIGRNAPQRVLITMTGPNGSTLQGTFPVWPTAHKEEYKFRNGDFLYISGQNSNSWNAAFEVRILVNGVVKSTGSGFGYSVASAESVCR